MPSNIIIELAERDGEQGVSSAEWVNSINPPQIIENGDVIQIKTALINTLDATTSNIVLPDDVLVRIVVGMYDNPILDAGFVSNNLITNGGNYEQFRKSVRTGQGIDNDPGLFNQPYLAVCRNSNDEYTLFSNEIIINIKAGVYEPQDIANQITQQMQNFDGSSYITRGMFFSSHDSTEGWNFQSTQIATNATQIAKLDVIMMGIGDVKTCLDSQEVPNEGEASSMMYSYQTDGQGENYALGAPSSELSFDGERFIFKFLHTPLMISSNVDEKAPFDNMGISMYRGGVVKRNSGVFLRGLSPASFWDKLGFDSTTVFLNDDDITGGGDISSILSRSTTEQYAGADAYRNKGSRSVPQIMTSVTPFTWLQYGLSDLSTQIIPKNTYQADRIGYYLLETITNFNTDYVNNGTITSIMSKQYNNADFITVYSESSIPYQHIGEPVMLSSIRIRILDPTTNLPVDSLGQASVVFLEIIKAEKQPAIKSK